MKFYVEQTLGRLLKWLRLLGFDAEPLAFSSRRQDRLRPLRPGVYYLSGQTSWPARQRRPDLIILTSREVEGQLLELHQRLQLTPATWEPLGRCSQCNTPLRPLPADQAEGRVPDYVAAQTRQFHECPDCRRVFWEGSHQRRIRRQLAELARRQAEPAASTPAAGPPEGGQMPLSRTRAGC